jgi:hypothetical protein
MLPRTCVVLILLVGPCGVVVGQAPDPEPPAKFKSVEDTVWSGSDTADGRLVLRFLKGGILDYSTATGTYRNGTWKQKGGSIYLEMNNKYAEYHGTMKGNEIAGKGGNRAGLKWTWTVKKLEGGKP